MGKGTPVEGDTWVPVSLSLQPMLVPPKQLLEAEILKARNKCSQSLDLEKLLHKHFNNTVTHLHPYVGFKGFVHSTL